MLRTLLAGVVPLSLLAAQEPLEVRVLEVGATREVRVGDELFTIYRTDGKLRQPILYPVLGPGQTPMTRRYPQEEAAEGEATDHMHHRSLWFTHGAVNGVDFWAPQQATGAEIVHDAFLPVAKEDEGHAIRTRNLWQKKDGTVVCTDERYLRFGARKDARWIDYRVVVHADHGELLFGDTKEGTMAIRMAPTLRLSGKVAKGQVRNSEGVEGKDAWGKRAKWVAYWGPVGDETVTLALLDHPTNPRHPCWWHARDYGLLAANPFGAHDFEGAEKGTGDLTVAEGESLTFTYRFWFARGDIDALDPAARFAEFAAETFPTFEDSDR